MRTGVRDFRRQPIGFASQMGLLVMLTGLLLALPGIGLVLVLALLPGLSAGWVACTEAARRGERVSPARLLSPFVGPDRAAIALLGLMHAALAWGVLALVSWADPDFRELWLAAMGTDMSDEARGEAMVSLQQGMLWRVTALVPIVLAFWSAPVIAVKDHASAPKALFGSLVTSFHHLGALSLYGVSWVLADIGLSLLMGTALAVAGASQWAFVLAMPASLFFCAAFYASMLASIEGCLRFDDAIETPPVISSE